jgi:hypothetical protein
MTGSSYHYFDVSILPRLHHIVWCRPPGANGHIVPGHVVRPALVRGSKRDPATRRGALLVSYGTTRLKLNQHEFLDLVIQNNRRLAELDLPMAVRFDLGLMNWLPWAAEFFAPPEHSVYIVAGPLSDSEKSRLRTRLRRRGIITAL